MTLRDKLPLDVKWMMLLFVALFVTNGVIEAQPNLTFKRVNVNWPTVELFLSVGCDGAPAYNMAKQDFHIYENGIEITNFTLSCPDPTIRCAMSVSLVFDASGSMAGPGTVGAKEAGHAFIDLMDGVHDEAAILWFSSVVTIMQQMTNNKPALSSAVDALPAGGVTAVWDGIYAGLLQLINNGVNQCRGVIVLTDGGDNSSSRQPSEIIALANRHHIRIITVGLGSSINSVELELIAQLTGGKYYQTPNAGQLAAIYQEAASIFFNAFQECELTYVSQCADGALRTVELQLRNFCGGNDSKTKTFRAPLDSTTFSPLQFEVGDATIRGGLDVTVPLQLITPLSNQMFYPLSFIVSYDPACLDLRNATIPTTSLLAGTPVTITPVPNGLLVQTTDRKLINGSGLLMDLNFRAINPVDTTCCQVDLLNLAFAQGCFLPTAKSGEICVYPYSPSPWVSCDMDGPRSLNWDRGTGSYLPNPMIVKARAYNTGDLAAINSRFRITVDTSVFLLISPQAVEQAGSPVDIPLNGFGEAAWQLLAKPQANADSSMICIDIMFDNFKTLDCCYKVYIPGTDSELSCDLSVPVILVDTMAAAYDPMPFEVTVTARNNGQLPTDTVLATISFAADLAFAAPDTPLNATKTLTIPVLNPGQSSSASWMLRHAPSLRDRDYSITVTLNSGNEVSICERQVHLSRIPTATFSIGLTANGPLTFCEGGSVSLDAGTGYASYRWNTGSVSRRLTVTSSGSYYCVVKSAEGNTGMSDTVQVVVHPNPAPSIAAIGFLPMCEGDSVELNAGAGFTRYLWNTGSDKQTIIAKTAGNYIVTVWNGWNCVGRDSIVVTTWPAVPKPFIQRSGDSLIASGSGLSYRWYRDGMLLPGAVAQSIRVALPGGYTVEVADANGCTALSDLFSVTVLDAGSPPSAASFQLLAYPDPADDFLHIQLKEVGLEPLRVVLTDVLGRSETVFTGHAMDTGLDLTVSLQGWASGPLFIQAWYGETVVIKKVMRR